MTKKKNSVPEKKMSPWALPMIGLTVLAFIVGVLFLKQSNLTTTDKPSAAPAGARTPETIVATDPAASPPVTRPASEYLSMEVNKAVMVTADLDFGAQVPGIAQALSEIERRYDTFDHQGRTFAILDAYGEATPAGKLHISMHVSSEKPGAGSLVFRRTGQVLWQSKITVVPGATSTKNLTVYVGDDQGGSWVIDGSNGTSNVLDAKVRDKGVPVRDFWPDGADREVTFVYSACGCPVKVMARRTGNRTTRTQVLPVIFPDDAPAVTAITRLMGW
jgi:hypothetical protein